MIRTIRLFPIPSGERCPETGTYYSNYREDNGKALFDSIQEFEFGDVFPQVNGKPARWTHFTKIEVDY